jgi:hypothetical protein
VLQHSKFIGVPGMNVCNSLAKSEIGVFWYWIWRFSGIGCAELASGDFAGTLRRNEAGLDGPASL